ncbi:MAG: hypothetical protein AB7O26_11755, partial [Planctomycetaceae bacterium]
WVDSSYSVTISDPTGWKPARPEEISAQLRNLQQRAAQFAFRSTEPQLNPITLNLAKVLPRLAVDALSLVTVTETAVHHTLMFRWRILQGSADTFLFTTPDWLAGRLDFPDPRVRQVSEAKLPDGRIRWTIVLDEPLREEFVLAALAVLPSPSGAEISGPRIVFEEPTSEEEGGVRRIAAQRQFVVLVNHSESQLAPAAAGTLEPVEANDLPIRIREDLIRQAMQIGAARTDQPPKWARQRLVREGSAPASVNLADLLTVVEKDGSYRTRLAYRIKNRSRQFLALKLPAESRLLSAFVADEPARPVITRKNEETLYLIALPKTSDAALSFIVEAVVTGVLPVGELTDRVQLTRTDVQLPVPEVVTPQDDEEFGIPVARTRWTVYFPNDQDVEIVDDPRKTNLSALGSESEQLIDLDAALSEAGALLAILKETGSSRARYEAYGNLKKLEKEFQSDSYGYQTEGEGGRLLQRRSQILGDIRSNEAKIRIDQKEKRALTSESGKSEVDFDADVQSQQAQQILSDNRSEPAESEDVETHDFFFQQDFADTPAKPSDKTNVQQRFGSERASGSKRDLSERRQKGSQQLELNRQIEENARSLSIEQRVVPQTNAPPPQAAPEDAPQSGEDKKATDQSGALGQTSGSTSGPAKEAAGKIKAGSLSLKVQIPIPPDSRKIVLSKPGGSPRLSVAVRPKASLVTGLSYLWTLAWMLLAVGIIAAFGATSASPAWRRHLPKFAVVLGLIASLLLPMPLNLIGVAVFVVSIAVALRRTAATI